MSALICGVDGWRCGGSCYKCKATAKQKERAGLPLDAFYRMPWG